MGVLVSEQLQEVTETPPSRDTLGNSEKGTPQKYSLGKGAVRDLGHFHTNSH